MGLLPAGGKATRISPLPCSKEIYPVGMRIVGDGQSLRPKVAAHYLLEKMKLANAEKAYIILGDDKWDIPAYFKNGGMVDMHLAYLMMNLPFGVPYTLDQAYPFISNSTVLFGFPDIIFQPKNAYIELLSQKKLTNADIVLGLFTADDPKKMDMVKLNSEGRPCRINIKPSRTSLQYTWIIAVWSPAFTEFMHRFVISDLNKRNAEEREGSGTGHNEVYVGDVISAAIDTDLKIETVLFSDGKYLDIGTPEDLAKTDQFENVIMEDEHDYC